MHGAPRSVAAGVARLAAGGELQLGPRGPQGPVAHKPGAALQVGSPGPQSLAALLPGVELQPWLRGPQGHVAVLPGAELHAGSLGPQSPVALLPGIELHLESRGEGLAEGHAALPSRMVQPMASHAVQGLAALPGLPGPQRHVSPRGAELPTAPGRCQGSFVAPRDRQQLVGKTEQVSYFLECRGQDPSM